MNMRLIPQFGLTLITVAVLFAFGIGAGVQAASITNGGLPTLPLAPTNLEARSVGDQLQITLLWQDNADNEDSFVVERSHAGASGPWDIVATPPANSTQYDDIGLTDGVTYWYRVAATNEIGMSGYSNVVSGTATALPAPPTLPTNLEARVVADQLQITLLWQDNADNEDSFVVERSTAGASGPWDVVATPPANSTQYDDTGLADGVTYWYRVAATNAIGMSGYSNVVSGTATALPTPPLGDANCDGSVNSVDAALILQLDAGLLASSPCLELGDVNGDSSIDAVDAALVLQFDAGLIDSLIVLYDSGIR